MAAPKAPCSAAARSKEVSLDEAIFAAEVKPHLVHEAVRAELNARRQGTRAAKSRGLVSGGRCEAVAPEGHRPRAPGHDPRGAVHGRRRRLRADAARLLVKVNKKAMRAALRAALSDHAQAGTFGARRRRLLRAAVDEAAVELLSSWGGGGTRRRLLVVDRGRGDARSSRSATSTKVLVTVPAELEVAAGRLGALARRQRSRAAVLKAEGVVSLHPASPPRQSCRRRATTQITENRYTFKVHQDAHKTQIRQAVEELFEVKVVAVNIIKVQPKPKRRGLIKGIAPRLEEGHRRAQGRRDDRDLRGGADLMPVRRSSRHRRAAASCPSRRSRRSRRRRRRRALTSR